MCLTRIRTLNFQVVQEAGTVVGTEGLEAQRGKFQGADDILLVICNRPYRLGISSIPCRQFRTRTRLIRHVITSLALL